MNAEQSYQLGGSVNRQEGEARKELPLEFGLTEKIIMPWLQWQRKEQGIPGVA